MGRDGAVPPSERPARRGASPARPPGPGPRAPPFENPLRAPREPNPTGPLLRARSGRGFKVPAARPPPPPGGGGRTGGARSLPPAGPDRAVGPAAQTL